VQKGFISRMTLVTRWEISTNSRVNNKGQEFIKFTKNNSHHVKQDNKTNNHISNTDVNVSYMSYHAFDTSYILIKNKYRKVITLYVGSRHKRHNTYVWVPKVFVTNVKGHKQVWVPKNKA
jgi:hypothetical protein